MSNFSFSISVFKRPTCIAGMQKEGLVWERVNKPCKFFFHIVFTSHEVPIRNDRRADTSAVLRTSNGAVSQLS